jgi:hypothetical protein
MFNKVDWDDAFRVQSHIKTAPSRLDKPLDEFLKFLWPLGSPYLSPLPTTYLFDPGIHEKLKKDSELICRDGLLPLLWFFKSNPVPKGVRARLYIDEELSSFIPKAWKKHVGNYTHVSLSSEKAPQRLIFTAVVHHMFCSIKKMEDQLLALKKIWGEKKLNEIEKVCFLIGKWGGYGVGYKHEYHSEFVLKLSRITGLENIKMVNAGQLGALVSLDGSVILEGNDKLLCANTFTYNNLQLRGARAAFSVDKIILNSGERLVEASPHHGLILSDLKNSSPKRNRLTDLEQMFNLSGYGKMTRKKWMYLWSTLLSQKAMYE